MKKFIVIISLLFSSYVSIGYSQNSNCLDLAGIDFGPCTVILGYAIINGECTLLSGCSSSVDGIDYEASIYASPEECLLACSGECMDLMYLDFGPCPVPLGYAMVDGECVSISGCSTIINGIDFSPFIYGSPEECELACSGECMDLMYLDFGPCPVPLGFAMVDGECVSISGCNTIINGFDFSPFIYSSPEVCALNCGPICMDLYGIDFGDCDMFMGYAMINGNCVALSGCGSIVDGIDYAPFIFDLEENCISHCQGSCLDLSNLDFGICALPLGIAIIEGECTMLSGCSYEVNGVDYEPYFFFSMDECISSCFPFNELCVIPEIIDSSLACDTQYEPVCGCDGITYSNDCAARLWGGVAYWTMGECTVGIIEKEIINVSIYPNPAKDFITIENPDTKEYSIQIVDISGKLVLTKEINSTSIIDISYINSGIYILRIMNEKNNSLIQKLIIN